MPSMQRMDYFLDMMAPMGPHDLCSYALVMMALQRRGHTRMSDSGRLPE